MNEQCPMDKRLAVIIVSANSASWLRPCLTTVYERAGDVDLDVVVVAAGCTDEQWRSLRRNFLRPERSRVRTAVLPTRTIVRSARSR